MFTSSWLRSNRAWKVGLGGVPRLLVPILAVIGPDCAVMSNFVKKHTQTHEELVIPYYFSIKSHRCALSIYIIPKSLLFVQYREEMLLLPYLFPNHCFVQCISVQTIYVTDGCSSNEVLMLIYNIYQVCISLFPQHMFTAAQSWQHFYYYELKVRLYCLKRRLNRRKRFVFQFQTSENKRTSRILECIFQSSLKTRSMLFPTKNNNYKD